MKFARPLTGWNDFSPTGGLGPESSVASPFANVRVGERAVYA